ncbi:ABC transporter permease [Kitasatospora cineracea]|uniref:Peptide/nickel transport system permease protein n=1 Tax=Kitasatospora cineracea TaxID=88074 RepID=A0A8G1XE44_9ACTN|nr:ABC transporter permease [Kitasatospora cineracea]ROR46534.1 peptide/nickel transport system permease protein [Kitasatospora cineracea]
MLRSKAGRRIAATVSGAVATVLVASFVIFAGLAAAPGDPVSQILGPKASDEARASMRERLGLDAPLPERYWSWLTHALHGDLGMSLTSRQDVSSLIEPRLLTTFLLVAMASVLIITVGVSLGVFGGVSERARGAVATLVGLGIAVPGFIAANVLIGVFAVQLGWFPTFGGGEGLGDRIWHLTLPSIALSIGYGAYVTQLTSAAIAEEAEKDYVTTAHGRGVPPGVVLRHHTLRNAAMPVLTASGLSVAGLVAGTVVVEQIFAVDGIGALLIRSISSKDYPVVTAVSMIIVVAFVLVTTLIDLVQVALDPRERAAV